MMDITKFHGLPRPARVQSGVWLGKCYAVFCIMIYSGGLTPSVRFYRGEGLLLPGRTDWINTAPQLIILIGVLLFLSRRWREVLPILRPLTPYLLISALCVLSTLWSAYPTTTLRRSCTLSICMTFGIYCYVTYGLEGTIKLLGTTTIILAGLSLIAFVAVPSVGFEGVEGYTSALRGVYSQKNNLGTSMVLGISCYLYLGVLQGRPWRPGPWLAIGFMLGCIVLAQSMTSLLVSLLVITCALGFAMARSTAAPVTIFVVSVVILVVAFVIVFWPDLLLNTLGRDPSLTGRLPLWQLSLQAVEDNPWFGSGYYAFWNENSRWSNYIWQAVNWRPPSAHNGYLEVALEIGVVGLVLYTWMLVRAFVLAVAATLRGDLPVARWILLYLVLLSLLNLDEGTLPYPDEFALILPGMICSLEAWRARYRRQQRSHRQGTIAWSLRLPVHAERS